MEQPVYTVEGFRAAGIAAGIKKSGRKDLLVIVSDTDCSAAGMFTRNTFCAAPVVISREHLQAEPAKVRAIIINSGNANACTSEQGLQDARTMAESTARALGLRATQVLVASTGIIGEPMPMDKIVAGIEQLKKNLNPAGWQIAAETIMTTDTRPKIARKEIMLDGKRVSLLGIAKGAGMIHPNMATLLGFIVTDAAVSPTALDSALRSAVGHTFNCLTVDRDTSTNDTVFLLANGVAGNEPVMNNSKSYEIFQKALIELCTDLVKQLAADGEGATKLLEIVVNGADSYATAKRVAESIATSLLVKTAMFGNDPNWGRIVCAIGYSGAEYNPRKVSVRIGEFVVFRDGMPVSFDHDAMHAYLEGAQEVPIQVSLGDGTAVARYWTCDISYDYVEINAHYHT